jgi:serine/threonine-protein kinase
MARIHLAVSADERQQVLALKRVHPRLASDGCFTQMLLDEAAIASCIRHENVVTTHGADMIGDEVCLVMDYVPGLPLHVIMQKVHPGRMPARFAAAIVADALRGLHAAHDAVDTNGHSLAVVHRDVSPQNILLGLDGIARVLDFGVAKAERRGHDTRAGDIKGKISYMAPEQLSEKSVDRRADVYAAAVVLWEALVGAPLFRGDDDMSTYARALRGCSTRPGKRVDGVPPALDAVVMRGLATRPEDRFATALDMARALDSVFAANPARPNELGAWLRELGAETLRKQARVPAELRRRSAPPLFAPSAPPPPMPPPTRVLREAVPPLPLPHERLAMSLALFFAGCAFGLVLAITLSRALGIR